MKSNSKNSIFRWVLPLAAAGLSAWLLPPSSAQTQSESGARRGTVEKIKVHGKSLEGNLEGDSPDRDVFVYLPPSYATQPNRRYPVVYFLHGYGINAEAYWKIMTVPEAADQDMGSGKVHEMILVHPDAFTIYSGSMYSNSPTTGNWEAYITHDLVSYIDGHYRTIADRNSRGLAGHSMGGYGTLRIAMKYPEVYSSIYAMSACCLMNNPAAAPRRAPATQGQGNRGNPGRAGVFAKVLSAEAAAWSPDPKNPPKFFDLPTENGAVRAEIAAKWIANSPLAMIDQYVPNLMKYHAIMMDVGLQDGLAASNQEMDASLSRLGIRHTFETYEGNHTNRVKERFAEKVLPFFSQNLSQ
ncbi:MAG TPA: alpha/beta hydrolase-fold protein [Bryobacteraceae bacterium]|nr:alpha/beta hydrolase-fold protein [Bryobacteraceae bacterium]